MPNDLPNDLISLKEACQLINKSKNTIRWYVSNKKLTKYSKDPTKQNSPLLISKGELLSYCSINSIPKETNTGRKAHKTASVVKLHKDSNQYKQQYEATKRELDTLKKLLEVQTLHLEDLRQMKSNEVSLLTNQLNDTKLELERQRSQNEVLQHKIENLRWYAALPWYRRLSTSVPLLTTS